MSYRLTARVRRAERQDWVLVRAKSEGLLADAVASIEVGAARQSSEHAVQAARREAQEAKAANHAFLSGLNHELRTPLNHIMGFAGLLKEAESLGVPREKRAEYIEHILGGAQTLLERINAILEAAGYGETESRPNPTGLVSVLRRSLQEHAGRIFVGKLNIGDDLPEPRIAGRDLYSLLQRLFRVLIADATERKTIGLDVSAAKTPSGEAWVALTFMVLGREPRIDMEEYRHLRSDVIRLGGRLETGKQDNAVRLTLAFASEAEKGEDR
ncbi:MAG: histidine kinase dimerization/phospho-acceptor domain-containing protein [Parvularcula sp.]|nr:histidine kinase dimerization/phospho-acceptor domain-containing protein [Parvularcula sp.]